MPVVVLGEDLGKSFFQGKDAVGKWIDVDGHALEVIGVMERPAASFPGPGRQPHPDALLHHAQALSQRQREHADRDRL